MIAGDGAPVGRAVDMLLEASSSTVVVVMMVSPFDG
jgi:hypothetical protein